MIKYTIISVIILLMFKFASAEVPKIINYQGYLTDSEGNPVEDDSYSIKFIIYGSAMGTDSLWSSGFRPVDITDGLFTYQLGFNSPLPDDLFADSGRYLGITINGDTEIIPRNLITSNAYSYQSLRSDTTNYAKMIADNSITENKIVDDAVTSGKIKDGTINLNDIGQNGASLFQVIRWNGSEWEPSEEYYTGDITGVTPGSGLTGGGTSGNVTLLVADNGITATHIANNAINSDKIENGTIQFSDIAQNGAAFNQIMKWNGTNWTPAEDNANPGGDITAVIAGSGLIGGATSGDATLAIGAESITATHIANNAVGTEKIGPSAVTSAKIETGAVRSSEIENETITDSDISSSAHILPTKIFGVAACWNNNNSYYARNTFNDSVKFTNNVSPLTATTFYDSTMVVDNIGVRIGRFEYPLDGYLLRISRGFTTTTAQTGNYINLENTSTGNLYGLTSTISHTTAYSGGNCYGIRSFIYSDGYTRNAIYGYAAALTNGIGTGTSTGIQGVAEDGDYNCGVWGGASEATSSRYGVYGTCYESYGLYGGYFYGHLHATGNNTKGGGGYKIDHPDDPENMYLSHSDVSSPEMKNVYDGVALLDAKGEAVVELPSYFEVLNEKFRYQLTCIGNYAPVYISQKIESNKFVIAGGIQDMEVSWMVTGIRKDAFAEITKSSIEKIKTGNDRGRYLHPELFGYGMDKSINKDNHQELEVNNEVNE